ncbi:Endonuclease/exonuclease/phosphatase [Flammula alnicola]|nr:Endonuclease/exonuclease/phosphatase [Flammula alnicola]
MRVLTWNINGVRTLPQYHPWNTLKTFDDILNHLDADVICFQEMKSSRQGLPKQVALPPSFDSFFSFPTRKTGYSGIAVYTRRSAVVPLKAEEGLTGLIQPRPPLNADERISKIGSYPPDVIDPQVPEDEDEVDYEDLDSEGRAVVVDLGLFVLISVYCPNDGTGTEERGQFKMDYHRLLEARVNGLIKEGREVMVVGDLNACAAIQDHCEGHLMGEEGFWGKDYRRWIRDWLVTQDGTGGCMVDIVRKFWPDRKGMYTCWNTKISARETNYGTRIDFILITPGLVPWVKAADIQPQVKGSDHCPVFVDLRDEIANEDGTIVKLSDVLGAKPSDGCMAEPPRLAANTGMSTNRRFYRHFSGRAGASGVIDSTNAFRCSSAPSVSSTKRKIVPDSADSSTKKPKLTNLRRKREEQGQEREKGWAVNTGRLLCPAQTSNSKSSTHTALPDTTDVDEDADYRLALQLSQSEDNIMPSSSQSSSGLGQTEKDQESKQAWNTLLAPTQVPKCSVHGEPAKEYTVNKPGPNKGKKFFICSRPVGPGYDKGRSQRLREHVDPQWKCNSSSGRVMRERRCRRMEPLEAHSDHPPNLCRPFAS